MWRYGDDYRKAAVAVLIQYPEQPFAPHLSLLGHSIELALKAFLLAQGVELDSLKNKFRHDLRALAKEARHCGIETRVNLQAAHWAVIDLLSDEYMSKRFHYIRTGRMMVPDIRLVHEAAEQLCGCLEAHCRTPSD